MKDTLNAIRVGLFFIFGAALLYVTYSTLADRRLRQEAGYRLEATFTNAKTLAANSDVRMAGVRIGRVDSTRLDNGRAVATLLIEKGVEVPRDSTASIGMANLLGQNYVLIAYGNPASGKLTAGQSIPTRTTPDFNDIIARVDELGGKLNRLADSFQGLTDSATTETQPGSPAAAGPQVGGSVGHLFTNLNSLIVDNRGRLDNIFRNLDSVTSNLANGEGTFGKMLTDDAAYRKITEAADKIASAADQAQTLIASTQEIVAHIKSGEGTLGRLIYKDDIATNFQQTLANMNDFSKKLNEGQGTLGKLVNDDALYRQLRALLQQAEASLGGLSEAGPISAVGAGANALF